MEKYKTSKKIVIDGAIFGLQKAGGISRFWADTLSGLEESLAKEQEIVLLLPPNKNIEWESIAPFINHIKVFPRRPFRWNKRSFFQESLYLTAVAFKLRPTLWHSSYYVGFPLKFCKHKLLSFYDMIPEVLDESVKYDSKMKYKALKAADTILSISHHSLSDLKSIWPECAKNSKVIHLCASERKEPQDKNELLVPTPYLLYVGKRKGYKNFFNLLKYLLPDPRFSKYHLVAVGGEGNFSSQEQDLIYSSNAKERVHYVGTLIPCEVDKLSENASAILYPSIYEGFGLPVLEAFSCQVPVLACKSSSIVEIAGEEYPLANPLNPHTFGEVLAELLANRGKWVAYGLKRKDLFTEEKMIEALKEVYAQNL